MVFIFLLGDRHVQVKERQPSGPSFHTLAKDGRQRNS